MEKGTLRRMLEGATLGWTVSAAFLNPPVHGWEAGVVIALLIVIWILDLSEVR